MTNQLAAEASAVPDLDEYAGLSIRDIAAAIVGWPEGSEDQARAIAAIRARAPGIGHNRPPLAEALDEELAPLDARADELVARAATALVVDEEGARKANDLSRIMDDFERAVEEARTKRGRPFLDATRTINERYGAIKRRVEIARQGDRGRGGLRLMLTQYDDKREAEAAAARERAREEQRQREAEAEAARKAAEEAAAAGKSTVTAELAVAEAEEKAARAEARAEAIRPEPIRSHLGTVTRRREVDREIVDLRAFLGWAVKQDGLRGAILQACNTILGQYLRALGVDAVERGLTIPGVRLTIGKGPATSRR